ncbi:MAG: hypothetical protein Q8R76_11415 [Candidatus Omnitrophota bacterium]|nr:hypothetical protein [Candidatus Omnitrophota bacterium]
MAKKKDVKTGVIVLTVVAVVTVIAMALWGRVTAPRSSESEVALNKTEIDDVVERVGALVNSVEEKRKAVTELNGTLAAFVEGSFSEINRELADLEEDIAVMAKKKD